MAAAPHVVRLGSARARVHARAMVGSIDDVIRGRPKGRRAQGARLPQPRKNGTYERGRDEAMAAAERKQKELEEYKAWRDDPDAASTSFTPVPADERLPWVKQLYEEARFDKELANILEGTGGNPQLIKFRMQRDLDEQYSKPVGGVSKSAPTFDTTRVKFQTPFNMVSLWIWIEMPSPPTTDQKEILSALLASWFAVGRSGGYNALNTQCQTAGAMKMQDGEFKYDRSQLIETLPGRFHAMGEDVEYRGRWARCWFDLGTADEMALDVLLNMLAGLGEEFMSIRSVIVGGDSIEVHDDDAAAEDGDGDDDDDEGNGETKSTIWDGKGVYRSDVGQVMDDPSSPSANSLDDKLFDERIAEDASKGRMGLRIPIDRETGRALMDARPAWEDEDDTDFDAELWQKLIEEEEQKQLRMERGGEMYPSLEDLESVQMGLDDDEDLVDALTKDDLHHLEPGSSLREFYDAQLNLDNDGGVQDDGENEDGDGTTEKR
ncbi:hypothetical protein PPROV_000815300 [Pycnococcus provasolii]|uniref:Uncharacterized protein n=1 Tax=Pycnococcus provasolii TaxID=41880 RepID=A0A830HR58_9CHLO|nr:hypothetical protein PPROV_000815300 [Pycnococcus provasolii]